MWIKKVSLFLFVATLAFTASLAVAETASAPELSAEEKANPDWAKEVFTLGLVSVWAYETCENKLTNDHRELVDALKQLQQVIPFGKTTQETGQRVQIDVGVIFNKTNRRFLITSEQGKMYLIFGAPVSDNTMRLAGNNSAYLFDQMSNEPLYKHMMNIMGEANSIIRNQYGVAPLLKQDDTFNHTVMQIGKMALMQIPLDPKITLEQLKAFVVELRMRPFSRIDEYRTVVTQEMINVVRPKIESELKDVIMVPEEDVKPIAEFMLDAYNAGKKSYQLLIDYGNAKAEAAKAVKQ